MATVIKLKSQPLHNFSLPHLRWAHKNHHSPHSTAGHHSDSDDSPGGQPQGSDDRVARESPQPAAVMPPPPSSSSRTSRQPVSSTASPCEHQKTTKNEGGEDGEGEEEKPWNLRPRRVVTTSLLDSKNGGDGGSSYGHLNKSTRLRGTACQVGAVGSGGHGSERKRKMAEEKRKLWISLSKEEIEEDVYALTGSRPRKPKKRPRNVQKQVDNVFPALYLVGMSAESYRAYDTVLQQR